MDSKTTTTDAFCNAVNAAKDYCKKFPRKNKVAHWCEMWLDKNNGIIKLTAKRQVSIRTKLYEKYELHKLDLAIEKDGRIVKEADGNPAMSKENAKQLVEYNGRINELVNDETEVFMAEEMECKFLDRTIEEMPEGMDYNTMKALQGFVFNLKVKDEFKEDL